MDLSEPTRLRQLTRKWGALYAELAASLVQLVAEAVEHPILELNPDMILEEAEEEQIEDKPVFEEARRGIDAYMYLTVVTFDQISDHAFLRQRIRQILQTDLEPVHQRLLIQHLMSKSYRETQRHRSNSHTQHQQHQHHQVPAQQVSHALDEDEVILTMNDKTATYYYDDDEEVLGCEHYMRNCKMECPICRKWFTCRFCHDKVMVDHQLPRDKINHILCMKCFTPQIPSEDCIQCGITFAKHYCSICKLYDNDPDKDIYHCDKCGICRLGLGINKDYFHCDHCNACISIKLKDSHICIENNIKSNCPICDEYLFTTNSPVILMKCGHPIHKQCFQDHQRHSYKCPTCKKTVLDMEIKFRMLDRQIEQSIMPSECNSWKCIVKCCDCDGMSNVKYNYLGHKCNHCQSYNTMILKIIKSPLDSNNEEDLNSLSPMDMQISNSLNENFQFEKFKEIDPNDQILNKERYRSNTIQSQGSDLDIWGSMKKQKQSDPEQQVPEQEHAQVPEQPESMLNEEVEEEVEEGEKGEEYLVKNFIRVINNFDTYSNISEAFKDWISTSMPWEDENYSKDEGEYEEEYYDDEEDEDAQNDPELTPRVDDDDNNEN